MKKKAIIIGIKGLQLNSIEKKILSNEHPWGVILFERNIENFNQTKKLISSITLEEAKNIANKEYISGGMKPKINTCIDAMKKGVKKSTILDGRIPHSVILELFTEHGIGTQITSN